MFTVWRPRLGRVLAHCPDVCDVDPAGKHTHGYVPRDTVIGGGDDVHFASGLDCGQVQGRFPIPRGRADWHTTHAGRS